MFRNTVLRVIAGGVFLIQCPAAGYAQQQTLDQQVAAAVKEVHSGNYVKAGELVAGLNHLARSRFGSPLPPGQAQQAASLAVDQAGILAAIQQGQARYQAGDWQGSLYSFTAALFGVSKLNLAASPESRFAQEKARVQQENSPVALHQAARAAMQSGHLTEAADFEKREIAMIPTAFPKPFSSVIMHRAYTLLGLIYVAQNDMQAANAALDASIQEMPAGAFGPHGSPGMALASQLLIKGQSQSVLAYMENCARVGWSQSDQVAVWETAIRAGARPDFPKLLLTW